MNRILFSLFILITLLLISCGQTTDPTPTPTETAVPIAAATETDVPPTDVPPTDTAVPATATTPPEPATATTAPTSTDEPAPTDTVEPTELPTEAPTVVETAVSTSPPPTATTESSDTATAEPTEAPATSPPPPPPPSDDVPAPTDANYPGNDDRVGWENRVNVPTGFDVTYLGRVEGNPTSITFGPDGLLYIAIQQGTIHTMNSNGVVGFYVGGFNTPTGIAFRPGTGQMYVSSRVNNAGVGGESQVSIVGQGQLIGGLPCCYTDFHAANGIAFGPDGFGYVGVGGRADHGEILVGDRVGEQDERHPLEAAVLRFNPDSGEVSAYARGLRNPYDIAWDANNQLWATDNSPDYGPNEELHRLVPGGEHGYPWYDCDVCFSPPPDVQIIQPVWMFTPHSSPTGITAYLGNQFPGYYNSLFVTLWSAFAGAQKVVRLTPGGGSASNFATGLAAPIDVTVSPDGSLHVADWATGIIFKISYSG
ncbi:MAG: hypothetical protein GY943_09970 [Chloroflexi bacterium]|nr:hypothetical protein [Chloroflexota bacterium]